MQCFRTTFTRCAPFFTSTETWLLSFSLFFNGNSITTFLQRNEKSTYAQQQAGVNKKRLRKLQIWRYPFLITESNYTINLKAQKGHNWNFVVHCAIQYCSLSFFSRIQDNNLFHIMFSRNRFFFSKSWYSHDYVYWY